MFWPFKKRKEEKKPLETEKPIWWPEWEGVRQRYPIGRKFHYLGREMVVFRHKQFFPGYISFDIYISATTPALICEYADDNGVLREWAFPMEGWKVLDA